MPHGMKGNAANQNCSAGPDVAPATHFPPAKTQKTVQGYSSQSTTSPYFLGAVSVNAESRAHDWPENASR